MQRSKKNVRRVCALLLAAMLTLVFMGMTAFAADSARKVTFSKEIAEGGLTITANLDNPGNAVTAAVIVLEYDPARLAIDVADVAVLSGGMALRTSEDKENGYIGIECVFVEPLAAGGSGLPVVSFSFRLADGVAADSINVKDVTLCTSNAFLSGISSDYSASGGIVLLDVEKASYLTDGTVSASFDLPAAPGAKEGCGSGSSAGAIACIAICASLTLVPLKLLRVR